MGRETGSIVPPTPDAGRKEKKCRGFIRFIILIRRYFPGQQGRGLGRYLNKKKKSEDGWERLGNAILIGR
jgi:hypothetical protein